MEYYSQHNAWMTSDIFFKIMKNFNQKMAALNRKVLILLDQAPCHPKIMECFDNIEFLFFPKNATSHIQPLDLGIISSLKRHYKSILARHSLTYEDQNEIKYSILDAMRSLEKAWENVSSSTVVNCFKKSNILGEGKYFFNIFLIYYIEEISMDTIENSDSINYFKI